MLSSNIVAIIIEEGVGGALSCRGLIEGFRGI
jgi:hypothetical protein